MCDMISEKCVRSFVWLFGSDSPNMYVSIIVL